MLTHGSLFSGIGGFDLAAEWAGWTNVFHCEWNEFGQRVLHHHFPNSTTHGDITKTDFTIYRGRVDVLTGGFPCQPYSTAGKRLGKDDDRHLWPEMLRAIREISPRWVVGENVRGLTNWNGGLVFHEVQADLEAAGYEVLPFLLPAAGVGAPHERYRIWFVAHRASELQQGHEPRKHRNEGQQDVQQENGAASAKQPRAMGENGTSSHPSSNRRKRQGEKSEAQDGLQPQPERTGQLERGFEGLGVSGDAADSCHSGSQGRKVNGSVESIGKNGNKQFAGCFSPAWQNFPTQSPICSGDDELPTKLDGITFSKWRNESIKAYGNAVVPPLVMQIFNAINAYEGLRGIG